MVDIAASCKKSCKWPAATGKFASGKFARSTGKFASGFFKLQVPFAAKPLAALAASVLKLRVRANSLAAS